MTIEEYLTKLSEEPVFSTQLLEEFKNFGNELHGSKALRIHNKCLRRGHLKIAEAIKNKYARNFPRYDCVMAFGWALTAQQHGKQS